MADVESKSWGVPEWAPRALAAEFEPLPRIGVLQAARRHWLTALLPVLILVPVIGIVAAKRTPTYSAEARLMVGRLNISTPGAIAGFAQAAQDLASTYPLVVYADGVLNPLAKQLHMKRGEVRSNISATQVPSSSIVRLDATAKSSSGAIKLANAASNQLVSFLTSFSRDSGDVSRLRAELLSAEEAYQRAAAAVPPTTTGPLSPAAQKAKAAAETAKVQVNGIVSEFQATQQAQAVTSLLQPVSYATTATSDRSSKLQIALLAALVAGVILGLGLATLRANLSARRALTAPAWEPSDGRSVYDDGDFADTPGPVQTTERSRSRSQQ
jgi:capsular polysaccharide biosynthesis protein